MLKRITFEDVACVFVLLVLAACLGIMFLRVAAVDADDVSGLTREQREAVYRQPVRLQDIKED